MPITKSEKAIYNEHIKEFKTAIDASNKRLAELEKKKKESPRIKGYYIIEQVLELLKIIMLDINISDSSLEILSIKNEKSRGDARTKFYTVLQKMEDLLGKDVDRSLKENEEYLAQIERINPQQMLKLIQRIHFVLATIIDKIGEGSKWKWSFVELNGRGAVITKNAINFSDLQKYRDPRTEFYRERQAMMQLCKQSLRDTAQLYRTRYEQSTKAPEDILKSIELLSALRRIHILFSEVEEGNKVKMTIDALQARLEAEEKEKDKKSAKKG